MVSAADQRPRSVSAVAFNRLDGMIREFDPETSRSALAPVIDLFLATVTAVEGRGTPTLGFAVDAQLTVPPNDR